MSSSKNGIYLSDEAYAEAASHIRLIASGEVSRRVLETQLEHLRRGSKERLVANDITQGGGPIGDSNVAAHMSKQRSEIDDFYRYNPIGRAASVRLVRKSVDDPGNYALMVEQNYDSIEILKWLWACHFQPKHRNIPISIACSGRNLLCPPQHPSALEPMHMAEIGDASWLISFDQLRAASALFRNFCRWSEQVFFVPLGSQNIHADEDVIILANPLWNLELLSKLEAASPIRNMPHGVEIACSPQPVTYQDSSVADHSMSGMHLTKHVVLSRHHYPFQRSLTVISSSDDSAMNAVVARLVDERFVLELASAINCRHSIPDHFQVHFEVEMMQAHSSAQAVNIENIAIYRSNARAANSRQGWTIQRKPIQSKRLAS